jgi:hypothetical protein
LNATDEEIKEMVEVILDLQNDFKNLLANERSRLPYMVNILDEIHANENAHTRILRKLLLFKRNSRYPILEGFLCHIGGIFSNLKLRSPQIAVEEERIDLLIKDHDFSIIIENKINGAPDQDSQLERYIKKILSIHGSEDNIYILYLTAEGGSPGGNSITRERRLAFGERYREVSYRDAILPFLKKIKEVIGTCEDRALNARLNSTLEQYIDYLKGRFMMRAEEHEMDTAMVTFINKRLGLDDRAISPHDRLKKNADYADSLGDMVSFFQKNKEDSLRQVILVFIKELEVELGPYAKRVKDYGPDLGNKETGIRIEPSNWPPGYRMSMEFEGYFSSFFIGIEDINNEGFNIHPPKNLLHEKLKEFLDNSDYPNDHWVYAKYLAIGEEEVIDLFLDDEERNGLIKRIRGIISDERVLRILKEQEAANGL